MSDKTRVVGPGGIVASESPAGEYVIDRASGNESAGHYDLLEFTIESGPGVTPQHVHHDNDEAVYVLEGDLTVQLGDELHTLSPGSYAMASRGVPHTYRNSGESPARVLFTYRPGDHWQMLEEVAKHGPVEDESDIEKMVPILESSGVEMVGSPIAEDGWRGGR